MSDALPDDFAELVRQSERTGPAIDKVMTIVSQDLVVSLQVVRRGRGAPEGIDPTIREEVSSLVLESIWRYWVPEAKRRLASGDWTPKNLRSKLRTALCCYSLDKAANVLARTEARERRHRRFREQSPRMGGGESMDPSSAKLLARAARANSEALKKLGPNRAKILLRMLALVHESTRGLRRNTWSWGKLLAEFAETLNSFVERDS